MKEGKEGREWRKGREEQRIEGRERDWVCSWWCGRKQTPLATDRTPVACYDSALVRSFMQALRAKWER